ncbi:ankyrin repeat-containing protein At5g02620-like [Triticum dicoccoides]|uniref:ankyrin repeat-containing protein At5g02620-like n=1 Tax=Triticum dicoccoides TaxID=85692 RepID=UPI00188E32DE|nr:ankyrin repeat-containing protein At5g02620-like [Triticum dicoccoides]
MGSYGELKRQHLEETGMDCVGDEVRKRQKSSTNTEGYNRDTISLGSLSLSQYEEIKKRSEAILSTRQEQDKEKYARKKVEADLEMVKMKMQEIEQEKARHLALKDQEVKRILELEKDRKQLMELTPQQNTALHIAAELGHAGFAEAALDVDDKLLVSKNADGDTPLHLAARAGKVDVADLLIGRASAWPAEHPHHSPAAQNGKAGESSRSSPGTAQGPLSAVALKLLDAEPGRGHALNVKQQTPLHIAAREGLADVVAKIVSQPWVHEKFVPSDSVSGTALHQAVLGGHACVVEILLDATPPDQIGLTDSSENNALHYAAQKNNARVVKLLLNRKVDLAYKRNRDLQSPLHVAAYYGSTEAMVELLKQCPDVAEMVDSNGRNAFHVAITSGKVDALKRLLKHVRPEEIVNRVDRAGNTPLHLAASLSRIQSALLLLKDRRVNPCVLNREGQSARSLIEKRAATEEMDTYEMYLWKTLKKHEASRCKKEQLPPIATYQSLRSRRAGHDEYYELSVGTYTLVATLIATVSFAATFTMPGGYSQTDGTALHGHKAAFKIFVISNTVAMCSSIVVVFCFIWAWRDPVKFKLDQLMWGHRLTILACLAMVVSLMTAVYITVAPTARWPAYVVIAIGVSTPAVVFLILGKEALYVPM